MRYSFVEEKQIIAQLLSDEVEKYQNMRQKLKTITD